MSSSEYIDPATGDWSIGDDDQVLETEDITPELILSIGLSRGRVTGDPEAGSQVADLIRGDRPTDLVTAVEAFAREGLARLEDQGLATVQAIGVDVTGSRVELVLDVLELPETLTIEVSALG